MMTLHGTSTYEAWASERTAPGARVVAFERWVYAELANTLRWPADPAARLRQVGQSRGWVLAMVEDLAAHGYLFRPADLARLIREQLAEIRRRQDAGEVRDVWAYLRACWDGYVRREADRLREQAMSAGVHVSQVRAALLAAQPGQATPPSIVELVSQVRQARRRAGERETCAGDQLEIPLEVPHG